MEELRNSERRTSWKQIAHHLGVSERTAQKWERERGLPIRRLPGDRGRVYAEAADLDDWLRGQESGVLRSGVNGGRRLWPWAAAVMVLCLAAAAGAWLWQRPGALETWSIEGRTLTVADARGRPLWSYQSPEGWSIVNDPPEKMGITPKQPTLARLAPGEAPSLLVIEAQERMPRRLLCFTSTGRLAWTYAPEATARTGETTYTGPWSLRHLTLVPDRDGRSARVLTVWQHQTHYPAVVQLHGPGGRSEREYWHSGHFVAARAADFGDPRGPLIYLSGIANGYRQATLVVLDPNRFEGASREEKASFQILELPAPVEVARLLYPRTRLNEALQLYNIGRSILTLENSLLAEVIEHEDLNEPRFQSASLYYQFTPRLDLLKVDAGDGMPYFYRTLAPVLGLPAGGLEQELAALPAPRFLTPWRDD